jgi:hypothetical protein
MKILLSATDTVTLGKVLALAVSDDKYKLHLRTVRIASDGAGTVSFTATDGYIAHRVSVVADTVDIEDMPHYDLVIDGIMFVGALLTAAKNTVKRGTVELFTSYDGVVNVSSGSVNVACDIWDMDTPPLGAILSDTADIEAGVLFNGTKLGDIVKAATLVAGKDGIITMETMNTRKPGKITADSETLSFLGVIMPCRSEVHSSR